MKKVYVIFLADSQGNFDWVYTHPKPYYDNKAEAETVMKELIKEEQINSNQIKIKQLWKLTKNS